MSLKELGKFLRDHDWGKAEVKAMKKGQRIKEVARLLAEAKDDWEEVDGSRDDA